MTKTAIYPGTFDPVTNGHVDIAKRGIELARKKPKGVKFRLGSLYNLPYKSNYFDTVIILDVLEHLGKPKAALKEVSRVLKNGGLFHAFVPLEGEPYSLHFWLMKLNWKAKEQLAGHIQKFKLSDLKKMLFDCDLELRKKRFSGHLLGQLVDISYFTYIKVTNKKPKAGLEEELEKESQSPENDSQGN